MRILLINRFMSYIIPAQQLVFIHIPKTAGASVINSFEGDKLLVPNNRTKNQNYHSTLQDTLNFKNVDNYFKFTVVRNPWHRIVSWYTFRRRILELSLKRVAKNLPAKKVVNDKKIITNEYNAMQDFNKWLPAYIERPWDFTWFSLKDNQIDWIGNVNNVDKIFRFETLGRDFTNHFNLTLPKKNVSTHKSFDWRSLYNTDTIKLVEKVYEKDIAVFKYTFK